MHLWLTDTDRVDEAARSVLTGSLGRRRLNALESEQIVAERRRLATWERNLAAKEIRLARRGKVESFRELFVLVFGWLLAALLGGLYLHPLIHTANRQGWFGLEQRSTIVQPQTRR